MAMMAIARYAAFAKTGTLRVIPADGDETTTIADLAPFSAP